MGTRLTKGTRLGRYIRTTTEAYYEKADGSRFYVMRTLKPPATGRSMYSGSVPPWDFSDFVECVESFT